MIGDLFIRNYGDGAGNGIVFFFGEMDYALVGTSSEMEFSIAKFLNERAINQGIDIWQDHAQTFVCKNFFIGEAGVAPDVLAGLFLDAAGKLCEGLYLV